MVPAKPDRQQRPSAKQLQIIIPTQQRCWNPGHALSRLYVRCIVLRAAVAMVHLANSIHYNTIHYIFGAETRPQQKPQANGKQATTQTQQTCTQ
jgi:hypothetical protein